MQSFTYRDLIQLIEVIESSSQFSEFRFKAGDLELELRRGEAVGRSGDSAAARAVSPLDSTAFREGVRAPAEPAADQPAAAPAPLPAAAGKAHEHPLPANAHMITAPMVGTFYRAPEPGAAPFVEVGSAVEPDTTVCIIEVMKLMNSMPAGWHGRIERILVDDGEPVEYGQSLLVVVSGESTA